MVETGKYGTVKNDPSILRLNLLGRMGAITLSNENVLPIGAKTRCLLAILAMSDRKPVLRSRVASLLWSSRPELQARASLRQEIHRLLEALAPLGTEVIAVERHTIALKPALTSVDAERLLHATANSVLSLEMPLPSLLDELEGIDKAMDAWLVEQRVRIDRQVEGALNDALHQQSDPNVLLSLSKRLLQLNPFHETGWKFQIRSLLALGDRRQATQVVRMCAEQFRDRPNAQPGPDAWGLLPTLPEGAVPDEAPSFSGGASVATPAGSLLGSEFAAPFSQVADGGANAHGTILLRPLNHTASTRGLAAMLDDELGLYITSTSHFRVMLGLMPGEAPDARFEDAVLRQKFQVSFVLSGAIHEKVRPGSREEQRLVLKLTDLRDNGALVWATRIALDGENSEEALKAAVWDLFWSTVMYDARRRSHRPVEELDVYRTALRAFVLTLRATQESISESAALIERAESYNSNEISVPFTRMVMHLMRAREMIELDFYVELELAMRAARKALSMYPQNPLVLEFLARMELDFPGRVKVAMALHNQRASNSHSLEDLCNAIFLFAEGNREEGIAHLKVFKRLHPTHPLNHIFEPDCVLLFALGGEVGTALDTARALCSTNPQFTNGLIAYMIAAVIGGEMDEAVRVRHQLLLIHPKIRASHIIQRVGFLGSAGVEQIVEALNQLGLSHDASACDGTAALVDSVALGAKALAGYEGSSGSGENAD